jgi:hypothetical protein
MNEQETKMQEFAKRQIDKLGAELDALKDGGAAGAAWKRRTILGRMARWQRTAWVRAPKK